MRITILIFVLSETEASHKKMLKLPAKIYKGDGKMIIVRKIKGMVNATNQIRVNIKIGRK